MKARHPVLVLALIAIFAVAGKCLPPPPPPDAPLRVTTVDLPSAAEPAETPGTPGVVVTNPNLITQFGGADFSLNSVRYTRWRSQRWVWRPDAIVILVAGFGGGANNFKILAEDLIPRMKEDHGLDIEVWGFHRRSNQLEDREGVLIADDLDDPLVALDWYYGAELGLTLHPALAAGPNRRANFYNTSDDIPFLANWTSQVFSQDIDAVVEAARARAKNDNVFLGGHSAGTGFTARYASTDFDFSGLGPADPGYAKLRGLILLEGGGGSTAGSALSEDSLDRIEARFDGGLFAAVRDNAPRCVNGDPCTLATEATDCAAASVPLCTPPVAAYAAVGGLSPRVTAASEPVALQGRTDPDGGQVILQVDQGAPGNSAVAKVPDLGLLALFVPPSTVDALFGTFLDDDGLTATFLSAAIATSMGGPGPIVGGLQTWQGITEGPLPPEPDLGPPPTTLPAPRWGQEKEVVDIDRMRSTFLAADSNAADWYYAASGLSVTSVPGVCDIGTSCEAFVCTGGTNVGGGCFLHEHCGKECLVGDLGAGCSQNSDCTQSVGLDSTALSVGRGRSDIVNLTQAANIDVPVICFGGSNGLTPVPGNYVAFASSIGPCTAPSCDGSTTRVVDETFPNEAFPTFGDVAGGFEVYISEGFAHNDITTAEDDANNNVVGPLSDFIARNVERWRHHW
jgi:pimeloyl-ACP methyl ester carboxylesterase